MDHDRLVSNAGATGTSGWNTNAGGSPNVAVAGVGDTAGWLQAGGYLLVQKGGTTFVVLIAGPGASLDAAKSLALKVIARL